MIEEKEFLCDPDREEDPVGPVIEVVGRNVLMEKVRSFYDKPDPAVFILLAGDRISCCDEGVIMSDKDKLIGVSTIAPAGEEMSGQPTIVALYVSREYRNKGYGDLLLRKAIERCIERGFDKIRMDVLSSYAAKIIEKLPEELKGKIDVRYLGGMMDRLT